MTWGFITLLLPVASVCSLEPSALVTLQFTNVFLSSFLSKVDSSNTVLPNGMALGARTFH